MIGREREIARVREVLGAAAGGSGGAVVLTGPPGIGKSALLDASVLWRLHEVDIAALGPVDAYLAGLAAQVCGDLRTSYELQATAIAVLLGAVREAAFHADEVVRLGLDAGQPMSVPVGQILGAAAAGLRGDLAGAAALAAEGERVLVPTGAVELLILVRLARAHRVGRQPAR